LSSIVSAPLYLNPTSDVPGAANRFPDKCDNDPEGTKALNITASATLAKLCAERDIVLIYISTDYVFPGKEGDAPYEVTDTPDPTNLYGETKWKGEDAILGEYEKTGKKGMGVVLRVPVLYGDAERNDESAVNVLMDVVEKAQKESVKMDHWALRYPTNTEDVGRVCHGMCSSLCGQGHFWARQFDADEEPTCCKCKLSLRETH
jgi:S-adenosylmethionine synthetase